jgi:hypothetical protein
VSRWRLWWCGRTLLGAGSLAPGSSGTPCAPATVGVSSIPHISTRTRAISASPTSAAVRIVSLPSMGTLYLAWLSFEGRPQHRAYRYSLLPSIGYLLTSACT